MGTPAKPIVSDSGTNTDCSLITHEEPRIKTCAASSQTDSKFPPACDVCPSETTQNEDTSENISEDDDRYSLPLPCPFPSMLPLFESKPKAPKPVITIPKANLKKHVKSVDENRLPQLPRALQEGLHYFHTENEVTGEKSKRMLLAGVKYIQPVIETVVKRPKQVKFNLYNDYPHGYCADQKRFDYHGHNRKDNHMNEWTSYRDICAV